jgi:hypothetical protein
MKEDDWKEILQKQQEHIKRMEKETSESLFGKPLPFSKTPRGTIAFEWAQVDGRTTYEVDLSPVNDEASVRLIAIYHLDEIARSQLAESRILVTPERTRIVAYQIGGRSGTVTNPLDEGGIAYELAIKFWLIAENLTKEVSEIFHVEIPQSFDAINCTKYSKGSKEYKKLNEKFSL